MSQFARGDLPVRDARARLGGEEQPQRPRVVLQRRGEHRGLPVAVAGLEWQRRQELHLHGSKLPLLLCAAMLR